MGELIGSAFKNLFRKRSRTWLTVVGIAVGVMMVSVVTVLGAAGRVVIDGELESMGMNGLSVTAAGADILDDEALSAIRSLSCVSSAMPLTVAYADVSLLSKAQQSVLCGIDAGADQVISLSLKHGRLITEGDVAAAARVCVVDEAVAADSYGRSNIVGKTVDVQFGDRAYTLTVVGVTETGSSLLQNLTAFIPGMVYAPYTTVQNMTGQETFDQIAVRTGDGDTERAQARIEQSLTRLYDGSALFRTDNLATQKARLDRVVDAVALVLTALSGISLLVSGIGIMTIMLSSVSERTREIGIKKAIGATRGRILAEFLVESVILSACGGVLGLLPSVALTLVLGVMGVSANVSAATFAAFLLFSMLVGCVFGVYPAYKASRLRPVEALRSE